MSNGRRKKLRQQTHHRHPDAVAEKAAKTAELNDEPLKLGSFDVPRFSALSVALGANLDEYPRPADIPEVDRRYHDVVSSLFFRGGRLADHGLRFKTTVNRDSAMAALRAWLCSFAPKHEHKEATVAWALSEWCEEVEGRS